MYVIAAIFLSVLFGLSTPDVYHAYIWRCHTPQGDIWTSQPSGDCEEFDGTYNPNAAPPQYVPQPNVVMPPPTVVVPPPPVVYAPYPYPYAYAPYYYPGPLFGFRFGFGFGHGHRGHFGGHFRR